MRLLVVEDERPLAEGLARGLRREGYAVDIAPDGTAALTAVATASAEYDAILLDRDLPGLSGDQVLNTLRTLGHDTPVLMVTAAGTIDDKVAGLDLGADDYLPKPFAYAELLARLRALLRRATAEPTNPVVEKAGIRLDTTRRTVERGGLPIQLTPKEYGVLEALLIADGAWVSAEDLLFDVWDADRSRNVVKVTIHSLRQKLGAPDPIASAAKFGYRIEA